MTTFEQAKERPRTERTCFVRLVPGQYVNDDLAASGSLYSMTFPYPVAKVQRNGVDLTNDGSTPDANGEWLWTEATKTLQIFSTSAPSSTVAFVVYFYVFYTNSETRIAPQTPDLAESASNPLREWQPRLASVPKSKISVKNLLEGIFSIETTSIEIINADAAFQAYIVPNISFSEKACEIWVGLDDATPKRVYVGRCKGVAVDTEVARIDIYDAFSRLDQPCLMGDTADQAYYTLDAFPDVDPSLAQTPIPYVVGPFSRYAKKPAFSGIFQMLDAERTNKAVCLDYADEPATDACRLWGLFRADGLRTPNFGSPTTITIDSNGYVTFTYDSSGWTHAALEFDYFDSVRLVNGSSNYNGVLIAVNESTRQLAFFGYPDIAAGTLVGYTVSGLAVPGISIVQDTLTYYVVPDRDFQVNSVATAGGHYFYSIEFFDDFETDHTGLNPLHPSAHSVLWRARPTLTNASHADFIKKLVESVGLPTDSASFASAKSSLNTLCQFQIPQFDEQDYGTYLDYIQMIMQATLGILYVTDSFEVGYQLIGSMSTSETTNASTYLEGALKIELDYQDIVTQLIAYNAHAIAPAVRGYSASASTTVESVKSRHLHGLNNVTRFRHVLNDISSRLQTILDIRSTRRATYRFKTATKHLDAQIGDDMTLESPLLPGGASSIDLKILSLDKSLDDVEVEATDLEEI